MKAKKTSWEDRYYEKFTNHGEFIYNKGGYPATCGEVEAFIRQVRQEAMLEVLKIVERMIDVKLAELKKKGNK